MKKPKFSYADADGSFQDGHKPHTNEDRLALANRDFNRFPVLKSKTKLRYLLGICCSLDR